MVNDLARERGLEGGTVQTYVHPATSSVIERIKQSQALIQLLSFREDEDPESVNFTWLDFEYGVASGLGIPTIRLVDVVQRPYEWWQRKITTNPDQRVRVFRTDVSDEDLRKTLGDAIDELAAKLAPPPDL
jgi:hypothetical protein